MEKRKLMNIHILGVLKPGIYVYRVTHEGSDCKDDPKLCKYDDPKVN